MRRPLFDFVDQIRTAKKHFGVSREDIERELSASGRCEVKTIHEFEDENGMAVAAELRLNMSGRSDYMNTWKVVLKLHETRIDGVDYEVIFDTKDGEQGRGWHRHRWNRSEDSAERDKVPVKDFDRVRNRDQFLVRAFNVMRIVVNKSTGGETADLLGD